MRKPVIEDFIGKTIISVSGLGSKSEESESGYTGLFSILFSDGTSIDLSADGEVTGYYGSVIPCIKVANQEERDPSYRPFNP